MKRLGWIVFLLVVAGAVWTGWTKWGLPLMQARSFKEVVGDFGGRITYLSPDGPAGEPHRTGKVLVMTPGVRGRRGRAAELHSAWHRLPADIRATSPEEVETLVDVKSKLSAESYETTDGAKVVTVPDGFVLLEVHDWTGRCYIGSHRLEKGGPGFTDTMDIDDVGARRESVGPAAIATWVESLPLWTSDS